MSRNYKFVLVRALPKIRRAECDVVEVSRASIAETDFFSIVSQMEQCLPVLQGKTYSIYWRGKKSLSQFTRGTPLSAQIRVALNLT